MAIFLYMYSMRACATILLIHTQFDMYNCRYMYGGRNYSGRYSINFHIIKKVIG